MARRFAVTPVEFIVVLLILLAAIPSRAAAVPGISATRPTGTILSSGVAAGSSMRYPWYSCNPWDYSWCLRHYWDYYSYYPYSYYYPNYYYPTTTYQKTKTFELNVETNPHGIAPVNGKGTYNDGTSASFSVSSLIIPTSANQRYVFSSWSGDFSGAMPSGTVTMNSPKSVVANYQLQNFMEVSVDPPGIASATGEGWHPPTESVTIGPVPASVSGGEDARYVFQHWTIDNVPVSGSTVQVTMDLPHTIVAHYKTQYKLTVLSDYGIADGAGWYDAGSSATISVTSSVDTSYGVKQIFERWTGDTQSSSATATITMDSPHAVRAIWKSDSTILFATIALGILAAFALGIGLTMLAVTRSRAKPAPLAPVSPPRPVATVEPVPEKPKRTRSRRKVKSPPTTDQTEPSSET